MDLGAILVFGGVFAVLVVIGGVIEYAGEKYIGRPTSRWLNGSNRTGPIIVTTALFVIAAIVWFRSGFRIP